MLPVGVEVRLKLDLDPFFYSYYPWDGHVHGFLGGSVSSASGDGCVDRTVLGRPLLAHHQVVLHLFFKFLLDVHIWEVRLRLPLEGGVQLEPLFLGLPSDLEPGARGLFFDPLGRPRYTNNDTTHSQVTSHWHMSQI
jgi:hypothetical protein